MKAMKLIERLNALLGRPAQETKIKKLRKTIKALKAKQTEFETKLKRSSGGHTRQRLQQKIDVIRAQRRKGVAVYRSLKAGDDSDPGAGDGRG